MTIQQAVGVVQHKMLKLAQTRSLSREKVISTVTEQYDALFTSKTNAKLTKLMVQGNFLTH